MDQDRLNMEELEVMHHIDFRKGFANFHFVWPMNGLFSNGVKKSDTGEFASRFETTVCSGDKKSVYVWKVIINEEIRFVSLEMVPPCDRPMPILYRMVIREYFEKDHLHWGGLYLITNKWNRCVVHSLANVDDMNQLDGRSLHIFVSIPISVCEDPKQKFISEPNFGDEQEPNHVLQRFVDMFEKQVIRPLAKSLCPKLENDQFADSDSDDDSGVDSLPEVDITLKVVKDKKTEREFHCHKWILATQSPFFARNLRRRRHSTYAASGKSSINKVITESDISEFEFDDFDGDALEIALRYIYTGIMPDLEEIDGSRSEKHHKILNITAAAGKLQLGPLINYGLSKLIFDYNTDEDRAWQLPVASSVNLSQLVAVCLEQLSMVYALLPNAETQYAAILDNSMERVVAMAHDKIYCFGRPVAKWE